MESSTLPPRVAALDSGFEIALQKARHGEIDLDSAVALFEGAARKERMLRLFAEASKVRDENLGRTLALTAHIHMVTSCEVSPPCKYCSLSSKLPAVENERAQSPKRALIKAVQYATDRGVHSIVLVGGTNADGSDTEVREVVETVRSVTDVELGLDVGPSLSEETLEWLKGRNASTVYCSIESSNPIVFRRAKPATASRAGSGLTDYWSGTRCVTGTS